MPDLLTAILQFGPAGLIGLLWIFERRQNATRERQIDEAHRAITQQTTGIDSLLTVVKDNTRAMTSLEQTQRQLVELVLHHRRARPPAKREVA